MTIESAGKPIAVVLSPEEYWKLTAVKQPWRGGFAKNLLVGVDIDAFMAVPIEDMFSEYM